MAAGARNVSFIQHDHVTAETPPELCWWCFEHDEGGSYIEGLNNADGRIALSSIGFMNFRLEGSVDRLAQFDITLSMRVTADSIFFFHDQIQ